MLSLSSNCIEKITNLNGMSEYAASLSLLMSCSACPSHLHREPEDSLTWSKPD